MKIGKRVIALAVSSAVAFSIAPAVTAPVYTAQAAPPGGARTTGEGTLTITNLNSNGEVAPGTLLNISGTGFASGYEYLAFKLDDKEPGEDLPGDDVAKGTDDNYYIDVTKLPGEDGSFSFTFKLPDDISEGTHSVRVLSQTPQTSIPVSFTVKKDAVQDVSSSYVSTTLSGDALSGRLSVSVNVENTFAAESKLTGAVNGAAVKFVQGRATVDEVTTDKSGKWTGTVVLPADAAVSPETYTLTLTDADNKTLNVQYTAAPGYTWSDEAGNTAPAVGVAGTLTVLGLAQGAQVTSVKLGDKVLKSDAVNAGANGQTAITGLSLPNETALLGKEVTFTYSYKGTSYDVSTGLLFAYGNSEFGQDNYEVKQAKVPTGLYQTAYDPVSKKLVLTSSVGRPPVKDSRLSLVNPETLEVEKYIMPENVVSGNDDGGRYAVYGVAVDSKNGYIWTTNTRQNTVAVYDKDLKLVKQFEASSSHHARDIVVDSTTDIAYTSTPRGGATIDYYNTEKKLGSIEFESGFDPMSIAFDQETGILYTVSLTSQRAAAVDVRSDAKTITYYDLSGTNIERGSGVAWDPVNKNLYFVGQGNDSVIIYNVEKQEVVDTILTGDGALNAVYEPVNKEVWITSRAGGSVRVIDATTRKLVANIAVGKNANHASVDGLGNVYVVDKSNVDGKDTLTKITKKASAGENNSNPDENNTTPGNEENSNAGFFTKISNWIKEHKLISGVVLAVLAVLGIGAAAAGAGVIPGAL